MKEYRLKAQDDYDQIFSRTEFETKNVADAIYVFRSHLHTIELHTGIEKLTIEVYETDDHNPSTVYEVRIGQQPSDDLEQWLIEDSNRIEVIVARYELWAIQAVEGEIKTIVYIFQDEIQEV